MFWILKQSDFLHTSLLGDMDRPYYWNNFPCQKMPHYLDDIYVIKMAFHTYELAYSVLYQSKRRDFSENFLHHIVTIVLIVHSYSASVIPVGAVIMLVHDFSDVFVTLFRICVETQPFNIIAIVYIVFIIVWSYCRLYVFAIWCILPLYEDVVMSGRKNLIDPL